MLGDEAQAIVRAVCCFLVVVCSVCWLSSCGSAHVGPVVVTGPTDGQTQPPVDNYLESLLPGSAHLAGLGHIDHDRYSSLVSKFHQGGLASLTDEERRDFLLVAQVAFLSNAETLRYVVTSADNAAGVGEDHGGHATVEEVYVHSTFASKEGALPILALAGAHVNSENIWWFAGYVPAWEPEASGELWDLVTFTRDDEESGLDSGVALSWVYQGGKWTCTRTDLATAVYYQMWQEARPAFFASFSSGTLLGRDMLEAHAVYEFENDEPTQLTTSMRYWLDAETLWLRQYEFKAREDGAMITVKLEAVNEDIRIEPPDVDVECTEPSG